MLNTDNLSLLGITVDLNVYGFIDSYDTRFAPNHIDDEKRYAYGRQQAIGAWNLERLADAFTGKPYKNDFSADRDTWMLPTTDVDSTTKNAEAPTRWLAPAIARAAVSGYNRSFDLCYAVRMRGRLGLQSTYDDYRLEQQAERVVTGWVAWLEVGVTCMSTKDDGRACALWWILLLMHVFMGALGHSLYTLLVLAKL